MSWIAVVLIVTSAFMHAGWNFISKRRSPTLAFFFIAATSGAVVISPILFAQRHLLPLIPSTVWVLVTLTGVAQAVYFTGLAGAYKHGDMSLAYPLARALPVLSIAAIGFLLGRGDEIGRLSLLGMVLISLGCIVLPLQTFQHWHPKQYLSKVYLMAVLAAVGTTGYTLLDDAALFQMRTMANLPLETTEITILFVTFQVTSTAVMIGVVVLSRPGERHQLRTIIKDRPLLISGLLTGVIIMATYGLILASMAYVRDVSYVAAFRQLSIPIGAVLGLTLQQEPRYFPKLVGIAVISLGLILVGIG